MTAPTHARRGKIYMSMARSAPETVNTPDCILADVIGVFYFTEDKMDDITKKKHCERCEQIITARLVRKITTNGASLIFWECPAGHAISRIPKWIPHAEVKKFFDINSIPVIEDFSQDHKCVVCGKAGTEWHHFAPRHLFGDEADAWPGAYLCKPHHAEWHALVTPHMSEVRHAKT